MQLKNSQAVLAMTSEQFCLSLLILQNQKLLHVGHLQAFV